jgi:hypothetical protein
MQLEVTAAELGEGSVVASASRAYIARRDNRSGHTREPRWDGTFGDTNHDEGIDAMLRLGAQVLRHGTGEEVEI